METEHLRSQFDVVTIPGRSPKRVPVERCAWCKDGSGRAAGDVITCDVIVAVPAPSRILTRLGPLPPVASESV